MPFSFPRKKHNRPILQIPYCTGEIVLELCAFLGLLSSLLVFAVSWSSIPELGQLKINLPGVTWEGKKVLWAFPITSLIAYLLLTVGSRNPHKFNYPWPITKDNAERQYHGARIIIVTIKAEMMVIFVYVNWFITRLAIGKLDGGVGIRLVPIFVVLVFGSIGFLIYRLYRLR